MLVAQTASPSLAQLHRRLAAMDLEVKAIAGLDDAVRAFLEGPKDHLLLSYEERVPAVLAELPPSVTARVILLVDRPELLPTLKDPLRIGAVLYRDGHPMPAEELMVAVLKVVRQDLFGLEKYLAWGSTIHTLQLTDSATRGEALEEIEQFSSAAGIDARTVNLGLTVADELATNAFYNAPTDGEGRRRFAHLSRLDPVSCPPGQSVEVRYACDGSLLGISVRDAYGSLSPATALRQFAHGGDEPPTHGEHMGLSTCMRSSSQLVFNVVADTATECIGLIQLGSYRQFAERSKSCHFFFQPRSTEPASP